MTRKPLNASLTIHARVISEAKRLKVYPKAFTDRVFLEVFKDKAFYAKVKEYFTK